MPLMELTFSIMTLQSLFAPNVLNLTVALHPSSCPPCRFRVLIFPRCPLMAPSSLLLDASLVKQAPSHTETGPTATSTASTGVV